MGVTNVQAYADVLEVSGTKNFEDICRSSDLVLKVFDQQPHAQRAGEGAQMLKRGHRKLKRSRTPGVLSIAQVDDEKSKGDLFGRFERALDFVHGVDAPALLRMDDVHAGCATPSHFEIRVKRRVQRKCRRWIRPEPVSEI